MQKNVPTIGNWNELRNESNSTDTTSQPASLVAMTANGDEVAQNVHMKELV